MTQITIPSGDLPKKILDKSGITGLLAFILVIFLISVVYRGQEKMQEIHMQQMEILRGINQSSQNVEKSNEKKLEIDQGVLVELQELNDRLWRNGSLSRHVSPNAEALTSLKEKAID